MDGLKEMYILCPWWAKLLLGGLIVALSIKFLPLWDMMYLFLMIVLIPVMFLVSVGAITAGSYEAFVCALERAKEMKAELA